MRGICVTIDGKEMFNSGVTLPLQYKRAILALLDHWKDASALLPDQFEQVRRELSPLRWPPARRQAPNFD
jgi:hypothetical protein